MSGAARLGGWVHDHCGHATRGDPYVEHHDGSKRVLTVDLQAPSGLMVGQRTAMITPILFVDGRQFIVYWGAVSVEAPADRAVHLGVGMQNGVRGASVLLPPGEGPLTLTYRFRDSGGEAYLGPPTQD